MTYDVAIVGSGVAGVNLADVLIQNGFKVLILEAGPDHLPRWQYHQNYLAAPNKTPESPYIQNPEAPFPLTSDLFLYYDQKKESKFDCTYLKVAGGTTWHWLGTTLRFLPQDFQLKSLYGKGVDWPITYDDLEPWYEKAESALNVSGDDRFDLGSPRKNGYPKRPIPLNYLEQKIAPHIQTLTHWGKNLRLTVNPQARDPDICVGSRSCIPICPTGAKYEAAQHLAKVVKNGAELRTRSVAAYLTPNNDQNIESLTYLSWDGQKHQIQAKVFVIAANAIETAKLLLQSRDPKSSKTLANSSDLVGRNLMDHPAQISWALLKEPLFPYRGPFCNSGIDALRDGNFRKDHAAFRVQVNSDGWYWPKGEPSGVAKDFIDQGIWGKDLKEKLKNHMARHITVVSMIEQLPDPDNRITLSNLKDALGLPRPKIHYRLMSYEKDAMTEAKKVHELVFNKIGTTEMHHNDFSECSSHIMGTVRMGDDAKKAVVDKNLRTFENRNLFLLGSGVFPTSATANPTLTIAALAIRLGNYLKTNMSTIQ